MVRVIHQQPAASASPAAAVPTVGAAAPAAVAGRVPAGGSADDDGLCDVLSERALFGEITESLLTSLPDLTAAQVVAVRREVLALAK